MLQGDCVSQTIIWIALVRQSFLLYSILLQFLLISLSWHRNVSIRERKRERERELSGVICGIICGNFPYVYLSPSTSFFLSSVAFGNATWFQLIVENLKKPTTTYFCIPITRYTCVVLCIASRTVQLQGHCKTHYGISATPLLTLTVISPPSTQTC